MLDKALEMLGGDMDDMEGKSAMSHTLDECPDPFGCTQHDSELGQHLTQEPAAVKIEVHKLGGLGGLEDKPSLEDKGEEGEGLDDEDAEILKKLLSK